VRAAGGRGVCIGRSTHADGYEEDWQLLVELTMELQESDASRLLAASLTSGAVSTSQHQLPEQDDGERRASFAPSLPSLVE
jgi:hypothetical protein